MEAHQKDWRELFQHDEKNRERRQNLIRELPTDQRVKNLLLVLDKLSDNHNSTVHYPDGTVELSVPIHVLTWMLNRRSDKTTKSYIDLANLSPYLKVSGSKHRSHTYLICWMAIVDRLPGNETPAGGCQTAALDNARTGRRGAIGKPGGGQPPPSDGGNREVKGGQSGGQHRGQIPPSKPGY